MEKLKICTRCIVDTTTRFIDFDDNGICNYCRGYEKQALVSVDKPQEERQKEFQKLLKDIEFKGRGKKYNCVIGLSGGMDSSYLAVLVKEWGLRPLVVHFDNGWNTEVAVHNITNLVERLQYELHTYVVDWEEFKDLQIAYFKASVLDLEVPTDQLIFAILYKYAKDHGIHYILDGWNFRTEFGMPADWSATRKFDLTNLRNIHKQFGTRKLRKFPTISDSQLYWYKEVNDIQTLSLLNFIPFELYVAKKRLIEGFNYKPYQYKHYESIFTRFYQGYILPKKFGIDKRKAHLSTLIRSGFITREVAIEQLKQPPYSLEDQAADRSYVIKKWQLTEEEFEKYMKKPPVSHDHFGYDKTNNIIKFLVRLHYIYLYKIAYPLRLKKKNSAS
jgi:N-acetyl sugar amidotransferase